MNKPKLTPIEVMKRLENDKGGSFIEDGFKFLLDGPQMSPPEFWSPIAILEDDEDGEAWFTSGESGDIVDQNSEWVK